MTNNPDDRPPRSLTDKQAMELEHYWLNEFHEKGFTRASIKADRPAAGSRAVTNLWYEAVITFLVSNGYTVVKKVKEEN